MVIKKDKNSLNLMLLHSTKIIKSWLIFLQNAGHLNIANIVTNEN